MKPAKKPFCKSAQILTVGDELITGKTVDTNSAQISRFLLKQGFSVTRTASVGDDYLSIKNGVRQGMKNADLLIVTGGLGPTHDDITKKALCELFVCSTRFNADVLKRVERFFKRAKRTMPEICRDYSQIPTAAVAIENRFGLAPGLFFKKKVLALPGVPYEMENMLKSPKLKKLVGHGGMYLSEKIFRTASIGESTLSSKITSLKKATQIAQVAFLPQNGRVDIRILAVAPKVSEAVEMQKAAARLIKKDVSQYIWGTDGGEIEDKIAKILKKRKKKLAVAESCTGGGIGRLLTNVSGSSGWFKGGVIAYSNEAKTKQLKVSKKVLIKDGAVSRQTAIAMAHGAMKQFGADYGVSATGIAGPKGGTKQKPVGTIFVAVAGPEGNFCRRLNLIKNRHQNRERTCFEALYLLWQVLNKKRL